MATSTYREKREELLRIMRGCKFPGNKLPTEEALTQMLDCSRGTIREILKELEYKGFITKKHSVGNFMHPSAFKARMRIELYASFHDLIHSGGMEPSVKVLHGSGTTTALPERTRARLRLTREEHDYTERMYYADGRPAILSQCYIPKGIMLIPAKNSESNSTLYDFLKKYCNQEIEQMQIYFFIVEADERLATLFEAELGKPLLVWEESFYNYCDEIVAVCYNYFNLDIMQLSILERYQIAQK